MITVTAEEKRGKVHASVWIDGVGGRGYVVPKKMVV